MSHRMFGEGLVMGCAYIEDFAFIVEEQIYIILAVSRQSGSMIRT